MIAAATSQGLESRIRAPKGVPAILPGGVMPPARAEVVGLNLPTNDASGLPTPASPLSGLAAPAAAAESPAAERHPAHRRATTAAASLTVGQ